MNANTTANARKYSLRGKFYIVDSWGGLHRPTTRTEAAWYCDGIPCCDAEIHINDIRSRIVRERRHPNGGHFIWVA
jgi:hypothetical protein